jgi:hypothetical protein
MQKVYQTDLTPEMKSYLDYDALICDYRTSECSSTYRIDVFSGRTLQTGSSRSVVEIA